MVSIRTMGLSRRRAVAAAERYDDALPSLAQLAAQHRFDEIIEILQFQRKLEHWLCVPNPAKWTALHIVMPYHPPVALVDLLVASLGRLVEPHYVPEATVDVSGQTPLHVAASVGCDMAVIKHLTKLSHVAVFHRDNLGRLPLHCLCSKDSLALPSSSKRKMKRDCHNTVQCILWLADIYPQACNVRDIAGRTPLALAMENKMDQRVMLALLAKMPQQQQQQQQLRFRNKGTKTPMGSAATKSTSTWEHVPLQVVRADCNEDDDVSSVGLRSFHWESRLIPQPPHSVQQKHPQNRLQQPHLQHRERNRSGPVEV